MIFITTGGILTQIKTDGIGFQMIGPHELPQVFTKKSEPRTSLEKTQTDNFTDPNFHQKPSNDPLLDFLERRKKQRLQFENRYGKKAIGISAYHKQKDSPISPVLHNAILLDFLR